MTTQILKTQDDDFNGYVRRHIFGLNILPDHHPQYGSFEDPRLIFLKETAGQASLSGLVDTGCDYIYDHTALFKLSSYTEIPVGVLGGEFVAYRSLTEATTLFFSKIDGDFFDISDPATANVADKCLMFSILYYDALALFISPLVSDAPARLLKLLESHFTTSEEFIRDAVEIYEVVLTSRADGDFFECFASDAARFELLKAPLATAVSSIKETPWFRAFSSELVWDGDLSMCLVKRS